LDEALIPANPVVELSRDGVCFMGEPVRVIGASGFRGRNDGLDQLSAAACVSNLWVHVEVLQVTRGRVRPGVFME
jgi:hypothetical protein